MNSCELVSMVTAISCAIAKCVPAEDLPLITAVFGQISSTLTTITTQEEARQKPNDLQGDASQKPEPPKNTTPGSAIITAQGYTKPNM